MTERRRAPSSRPAALGRSPLPVLSGALASFLVVFTLLSARVLNGTDPAIRQAGAQIVSKGGRTIVRTTASGRVIREPAAPTGSPAGSSGAPASLVTRSSGTRGGESDG